jgi:hypothetical protein
MKKAQGNMMSPEVIRLILALTAVVIILSIIYVIFKSGGVHRGLW